MSKPISNAWAKYKSLGVPPILETALLAGGGWWATKKMWNPIANTIMSLARFPAKKLGITEEELKEADRKLHEDPLYKKWIPIGVATLLAGGKTALDWRSNERFGGLFGHDAKPTAAAMNPEHTWKQGMTKNESVDDWSNSFTLSNGQDMSQRCNMGGMTPLFQDPQLTPYSQNMGTAIINNAANMSGVSNPTLGNIFDSAVDKFKSKLTFGGLAEVGVKTVIANSMANLFTSALGTMTDLSPATQQRLVDMGTWAGAINAIMN